MRLKAGVTKQGVQPCIYYAIGIAECLYLNARHEMVVTSLTDGKHREDSLHYKGLAVDFRTRSMSPVELRILLAAMRNALEPRGYDVVLESDHLHVEYDPKGSESWLTVVT